MEKTMKFNVIVAVHNSHKQFAVTVRRSDQANKVNLFARKFEGKGFGVHTYATGLDSSLATTVRNGHKLMYAEMGYLQVKAS